MNPGEQLKQQKININDNSKVYYIKNKDKNLIKFKWSGGLDKTNDIIDILKLYDKNTPDFILNDIIFWLKTRIPPKNREHMENLLNKIGADTTRMIIDFSKGLSLIDTFWITDDEDILWKDINLFDNQFDEAISRMAFDGEVYGDLIKTTSPEFSTDGMLPKCWERDKNTNIINLKKGSTSGYHNSGNEPYSEVMATQVLKALEYNHVPYNLEYFRGKTISSCPLITSKEIMMAPMYLMTGIKNIYTIVNYCNEINVLEDFYKMIIFDYISLNSDRHAGNFAVLMDSDNYKIKGLAPIYDNGCSMLNYYMPEYILQDYINDYKHALFNNYSILVKEAKIYLGNKHNVDKLINFKFNRSELMYYSNTKINIVEKFIQERVKEFLYMI